MRCSLHILWHTSNMLTQPEGNMQKRFVLSFNPRTKVLQHIFTLSILSRHVKADKIDEKSRFHKIENTSFRQSINPCLI